MRAVPVGAHALLIECADLREVGAVDAEARRRREAGLLEAIDIVPAAASVVFDGIADPRRLAEEIATWVLTSGATRSGPTVAIPVRFDGADLAVVAEHWGVTVAEVPGIVCGVELEVAFCGFAPGFAYLAGLERAVAGPAQPRRDVPRLEVPRSLVPAGSVGLAGRYAGIYPRASPGGWQLIGTAVEVRVWDPLREPPALLAPGTTVTFVEA